MTNDLYQPPAAPVSASYAGADGQISPLALQHLLRTQVWVRLVSVIGLIMTIVIIGLMVYLYSQRPLFARSTETNTVIVTYIIMAGLTIYPLIRLSKYAGAIARLRFSQSMSDMEDALDQQRAFWKFIGIMMLICTALVLFALIQSQMRPRYRY